MSLTPLVFEHDNKRVSNNDSWHVFTLIKHYNTLYIDCVCEFIFLESFCQIAVLCKQIREHFWWHVNISLIFFKVMSKGRIYILFLRHLCSIKTNISFYTRVSLVFSLWLVNDYLLLFYVNNHVKRTLLFDPSNELLGGWKNQRMISPFDGHNQNPFHSFKNNLSKTVRSKTICIGIASYLLHGIWF